MDGAVGFLEGSRKLPSRDTAFEEIRGQHSTLSPVLKKVSANLIALRRSSTTRWCGGLCCDTKSRRLVTVGQVLEVPSKRIFRKELDPVGIMKIRVLCPSALERTARRCKFLFGFAICGFGAIAGATAQGHEPSPAATVLKRLVAFRAVVGGRHLTNKLDKESLQLLGKFVAEPD